MDNPKFIQNISDAHQLFITQILDDPFALHWTTKSHSLPSPQTRSKVDNIFAAKSLFYKIFEKTDEIKMTRFNDEDTKENITNKMLSKLELTLVRCCSDKTDVNVGR